LYQNCRGGSGGLGFSLTPTGTWRKLGIPGDRRAGAAHGHRSFIDAHGKSVAHLDVIERLGVDRQDVIYIVFEDRGFQVALGGLRVDILDEIQLAVFELQDGSLGIQVQIDFNAVDVG
jgi:hypothetical protein